MKAMLVQYEDPAQFLQHSGRFLEAHEAENNLILGISSWLATHPDRIEHLPYFAIVEERGKIEATAMMTPPHNLVLSRAKRESIAAIVEDMTNKRMITPGVNGPAETSQAFAKLWVKKAGGTYHLHRSLRIYQLSQIIPSSPVEGQVREASEEDKRTLIQWVRNFGLDIGEPQEEEDVIKTVQRGLADRRFYLWEDRALRSMAAWSAPTVHGVRISLVYTPPEFREKGYASACVTALSQQMLDSGRKFCCLFTDLSNPFQTASINRLDTGLSATSQSTISHYRNATRRCKKL